MPKIFHLFRIKGTNHHVALPQFTYTCRMQKNFDRMTFFNSFLSSFVEGKGFCVFGKA